MRRIILILCTTLCTTFFLSGCGITISEEVNEKSYVRGASFSGMGEKSVAMSFYDIGLKPIVVSGARFEDIRDNAEVLVGKSLFIGHIDVIVLGDCDYENVLIYLLEEWKIASSCTIIYGGENSESIVSNVDTESLSLSIKKAVEKNIVPECDLITVLNTLLRDGKAEIPYLKADGTIATKII